MAEPAFTATALPDTIAVGPIAQSRARLRALCAGGRPTIVTDPAVWTLHSAALDFLEVEPLFLPSGEAAKSWDSAIALVRHFDRLGLDRSSPVIAFGGGSVGDVAGFAASIYKRGCPVVHVPTTLLAQVDSAIGGKTAINDCGQKNLVGTFHQPALTLCDPAFLATLDPRQCRSGYAEAVKYGLIADAPLFEWCEAHGAAFLADPAAGGDLIAACAAHKVRLVSGDVRDEGGSRALLNFGHSFGHALEALAGPDRALHGEAVAVGMDLAMAYSQRAGMAPAADGDRVRAHFRSVGLPTRPADLGLSGCADAMFALMARDKKAAGGQPVLILSRGIGQAERMGVEPSALRAFLDEAV